MEYTVSITNRCNLRCSYCYERRLNTDYGCLSDETAERIKNFINSRNDAGNVYLFGGEPLLYTDRVKYFMENVNARQFVITTNGTLLNEDFLKWCEDKNVVINMSHDGLTCEGRGVETAVLDEKLKLLLKHRPDTLVQLVYTEETLPHLYENIMHFKDLGVKKVSAAMNSFTYPADMSSFGDILREQWKKISEIRNLFIYELEGKKKTIKSGVPSKCEICRKKVFINWDGKFYPCIQFQNNRSYQCGDIFSGIQKEEAEKAHPDYSSVSARCHGCEIEKYCRNSCACRKMSTTGTVTDMSEAACMEEQVLVLTALELLAENHETLQS